jgi:tRNA (cmo5U34)-methyltransferase
MGRDDLFAKPRQVVDFAFTDAVADVFPDMIRRSVPGYETIISLLGVIARQYIQANSHVYDLGSSLGASTLSVYQQTNVKDVSYYCVDNSPAMVQRCEKALTRHMPTAQLHFVCDDMQAVDIQQASLVLLNFTLQFIPPEKRAAFLQQIYAGLLPGGALVIAEKLRFADVEQQQLQTDLHHEFKRANGYSELEISQKRSSLENVLIPDTLEEHKARLEKVGFETVIVWFQCFNFAALLAVKSS